MYCLDQSESSLFTKVYVLFASVRCRRENALRRRDDDGQLEPASEDGASSQRGRSRPAATVASNLYYLLICKQEPNFPYYSSSTLAFLAEPNEISKKRLVATEEQGGKNEDVRSYI